MTNIQRPGDKPRAINTVLVDGEEITFEEGSGNVFADLGLPNPEEMLYKAQLVHRINQILAERKLTQTEASAITEVDQPTLSKLLRGRLQSCSTDRLFGILQRLGDKIEVRVTPGPVRPSRTQTFVRVVTAKRVSAPPVKENVGKRKKALA